MDAPGLGLPGELASAASQLKLVAELLGKLLSADDLHNREKLLVTIVFLLLLQNQHEVAVVAVLHHDPVHGTGEVYVRREKDYVFAVERGDCLVRHEKVVQHRVELSLPSAGSAGTRAGVGPVLAHFLVRALLLVAEPERAPRGGVLAGELDRLCHFLHCQVPHAPQGSPATGTALELGPAVLAY